MSMPSEMVYVIFPVASALVQLACLQFECALVASRLRMYHPLKVFVAMFVQYPSQVVLG